MVGPAYDFLVNPLGAVRITFEEAIASGSDLASFDGKDWGAVDLFRHFLVDQGGLSQVPVLAPSTVRWAQPNTLVRFRGMIQDMLGNELYVGAYKVPGLNAWAEVSSEAFKNKLMDWAYQQRQKRRRLDHESTDCEEMPVFDTEVQGSPNTKRMRADEQSSCAYQSPVPEAPRSSISLVPNLDGNLPHCLVKIYDCPESDLKLNDVFEFVGVLSCAPELQVDNEDLDFSNGFSEDPMPHLPASKVPYLHCIIHRKLAAKDFLQNNPIIELKPDWIKEIRNGLLRHLTSVFGNDDLAAHFMLLHLLSRVHARIDTVAVGKLSLNLTCFSKEIMSVFGNQLTTSIRNLLPFSCCIPLTVDYLNAASLAPRKDYDTNRLVTGVLQLAEGSHVIFDETKLEAGTLNSVGVENARLLKNLVELQQVEYDFKYYKMEMAADVQLLVLSEGKSNILPADVIVPFRPSEVNHSEAIVAEAAEAWRWYLATVRLLPHSIESEMQKVVENDLVAARQADRSLNPQDFSRWLTMGRLMSLSFGETSLSLEHWQMIKELERLRKQRLK
ncbi:mini-chromosome maintenance complex-binding protein isoform X2 [Neltuma alba]|uniref:mini-chromosome maintenance complex-binding protein isoform X2 n=1 Tax=Neltuma alba TaxID=207710 RepID=UPI0010A4770D|nr:mini-chromosome maintenance complex-binding protein-like isoform X2 [Prosopis alba]